MPRGRGIKQACHRMPQRNLVRGAGGMVGEASRNWIAGFISKGHRVKSNHAAGYRGDSRGNDGLRVGMAGIWRCAAVVAKTTMQQNSAGYAHERCGVDGRTGRVVRGCDGHRGWLRADRVCCVARCGRAISRSIGDAGSDGKATGADRWRQRWTRDAGGGTIDARSQSQPTSRPPKYRIYIV